MNDLSMGTGRHSFVWDGRGRTGARVESGVYYVRVRAGARSAEQKLVMLSP